MTIESAPTDIQVLLFDVGGVLVELSGVETMLEWLGRRVTADELWRMWLQSVPVRQFETGRIDAGAVAGGGYFRVGPADRTATILGSVYRVAHRALSRHPGNARPHPEFLSPRNPVEYQFIALAAGAG